MQTDLFENNKRKRPAFNIIPLICLVGFFLFSLCFRSAMPGFIPVEAYSNLLTGVRLKIAEIAHLPMPMDKYDIIAAHPYYYETFVRLKNSLVTAFAGMAVCGGGAMFQTMFKNPLASPNILGISTGVHLGTMLFIFIYQAEAMAMMQTRYIYCYACAVVLVAVTMMAGKLAGRRTGRFSIVDMLVVGSIISQFGNVLSMYLQFKVEEIDTELLTVYQELSMGLYVLTDLKTLLIFFGSLAISLLPAIMIRYRFNATVLDDQDAGSLGVNVGLLRSAGMVFGSIMAMTALIECGDLGIISMAIPPICRAMFKGADFRKVLYYSMCMGAVVLLISRSVCSMIYVAGMALPVNFAVTLLVLPFFVYALSRQRSVFE